MVLLSEWLAIPGRISKERSSGSQMTLNSVDHAVQWALVNTSSLWSFHVCC